MLKTLKGIRECDMMPFCQIFERSRQNGSLGEGFSLSTFRDKAERSILGLNNSGTENCRALSGHWTQQGPQHCNIPEVFSWWRDSGSRVLVVQLVILSQTVISNLAILRIFYQVFITIYCRDITPAIIVERLFDNEIFTIFACKMVQNS